MHKIYQMYVKKPTFQTFGCVIHLRVDTVIQE